MEKRLIPVSNEKMPVIGLGTWIQFDVENKEKDRRPLIDVLQTMHERNGRMIDTSPMYGRAEEVIGDLTSEKPFADHFFYATKVWTTGRENGIRQMEASLHKMRRKSIDLMQVHNLVDCDTHLETLREWKMEGKIRYTGVTHYSMLQHKELERIIRNKTVDFVQFKYSIISRNAEISLLNTAKDNGVAVIVHEPFETGKLFGLVKNRPLPSWTKDLNISSWGQFFLKYILAHPAVTCVIPGTSDPFHMKDNLDAGKGVWPDAYYLRKMIDCIESL